MKIFLWGLIPLFCLLVFGQDAAAQTVQPQGYLEKSNWHLELDGQRLSKEEEHLLLSDICGYDYNREWEAARKWRAVFMAETVVGGITTGVGIVFLMSNVEVSVVRLFNHGKEVDGFSHPPFMVSACVLLTGAAMLGTGIPLMSLHNRRMERIVDYYNGVEIPDSPPRAQLTFGPTPNGIGFALAF